MDYRAQLIRTCDKLIRQRIYYIALAKNLEADMAKAPPADHERHRVKIATVMRAAEDMKFISDRAMRGLPVEDLEAIHSLRDNR